MYEIIVYKNRKGESEIEDYLEKLKSKKDKDSKINFAKITSCVRFLKMNGTNVGSPYLKYLRDDIWELRPVRNRILFAYYKEEKFILLSIFMKKTQKTPQSEIEKAKRYLKDYIDRSENNE